MADLQESCSFFVSGKLTRRMRGGGGMPGFTKEQARAARQADLSAFLLRNDPGHYVREGKSLRLIDPSRPKRDRRKSISIKIGTNWWHDFATGETGNCVEYLTKRMGYSLVDAILALSDGAYVPAPSLSASAGLANADLQEEKRLEFPETYLFQSTGSAVVFCLAYNDNPGLFY